MEYIKVKDHLNLVRDPKTNAILNTNKNEYDEYMKRRNKKLSESQRVGELESDIEMIKNDPYITAHNQVSAMLKQREIVAYSCIFITGEGRTISVETDQGYNPVPFYSDIEQIGESND